MRKLVLLAAACLTAALALSAPVFAEYPDPAKMAEPVVAPEELRLDGDVLNKIDALIEQGIADGDFPGGVVCIGRGNKIGFLRAYGDRQTEPVVEKCTVDSVYDLASVTKVTATAIATAILVERGLIDYEDPIAKYFPDFAQNGKEDVTVRDCLTHVSGLTPDNHIRDYVGQSREEILANICKQKLVNPRGTAFSYSDVGFITMGYVIEKATGMSEDEFVRQNIYLPLGMTETGYNPSDELRARAAAAEKREPEDKDWIKGVVHDPRAYHMGGIAGHAGNFSTAPDLAILASMLIGHGTYVPASGAAPVQIMKPETFKLMTESLEVPRGIRSRGWDKRSPYSGNRGGLMSPSAIGHSGFTGTSYWIDPDMDLYVIFLGNRLHPDGKGGYVGMCGKIGQIALDAIRDKVDADSAKEFVAKSVYRSKNAVAEEGNGKTLTGADVLARDGCELLKGKRVGLLTNQTGVLKSGARLPKAMQDAGVNLTTLFSPEHGLYGALDQANIDDARDPETGLRVYSLYGETRRPSPQMLDDVDVFVFDIQDVGVRFYTYISALCGAMQSAADMGKSFVVLDRPNPINGTEVSGPCLEAGRESYIAYFPMPIRHGMTVGEIALAFAHYYHLNLDLTVVACENWRRDQYFDETGLAWVNPSPNMRSLDEALLYPGFGIPEYTNICVGRGTSSPFEILGAPWIRGAEFAEKLNALQLPGIAFVPVKFKPVASKYANENLEGVKLVITDRAALEPVGAGIAVMTQLAKDYPEWERKNADGLLLNSATLQMIFDGKPLDEIKATWTPDLERFREFRGNYLIY